MIENRNPYPRSGPVRGLLLRLHAGRYRKQGRELTGNIWSFREENEKTAGQCRWCRQGGLTTRAHSWHPDCVKAYRIARGMTTQAGSNWPLVPLTACVLCGADEPPAPSECDHIIPLAVGHELREAGILHWWKAWTIQNLQWLCRGCHVKKTAVDRQQIAALRKRRNATADEAESDTVEQTELFGTESRTYGV